MSVARIILFGGSENQVKTILQMTPTQYEVKVYRLGRGLSNDDLICRHLLFLLLNEEGKRGRTKLRRLKKKYPSTPAIMMESQPSNSTIVDAFRIGAADFLEFPPDPVEFRNILNKQIGSLSPRKPGLMTILFQWMQKVIAWIRSLNIQKLITLQRGQNQHKSNILHFIPTNNPLGGYLMAKQESARQLEGRFLGAFEIVVRGKKLKKIPGKKVNALMAYLLYHHHKPIHREILMDTFWPNSSSDSARNSLNTAIYNLRKYLQPFWPQQDIFLFQNECYIINPEVDIITDVEQFRLYWRKGRNIDLSQGLESAVSTYNKAIASYHGDFLEEMPYESWCESIRDNLRETYLMILNRLSLFFFQEEAYSVSINICKKILDIDPYLEEVHQRSMICYARMGLKDKSIRQYYKCQAILKKELNIKPSERIQQVFLEITEGKHEQSLKP